MHEKEMKVKAVNNSLMKYLNVSLSGLRGRHHPSLANIITANSVKKLRPHLKFLTGDYLTYLRKFEESGQGNPLCKSCRLENESISHILTLCPAYKNLKNCVPLLKLVLILKILEKIQISLHNSFLIQPALTYKHV